MTALLLSTVIALTGDWVGAGSARDGSGWSSNCESIRFVIDQRADVFEVFAGQVQCRGLKVTWKPFKLLITNGELWRSGEKIGRIDGDGFHAETTVLKLKVKQVFYMRLEGDELKYREEWRDLVSGATTMLIEGVLKRGL